MEDPSSQECCAGNQLLRRSGVASAVTAALVVGGAGVARPPGTPYRTQACPRPAAAPALPPLTLLSGKHPLRARIRDVILFGAMLITLLPGAANWARIARRQRV
jgi:hypothetical protein